MGSFEGVGKVKGNQSWPRTVATEGRVAVDGLARRCHFEPTEPASAPRRFNPSFQARNARSPGPQNAPIRCRGLFQALSMVNDWALSYI